MRSWPPARRLLAPISSPGTSPSSPIRTRKRRIREAAEVEERDFYSGRAPQEWLDALAPLGTDENKGFLETAPVLIAIFGQRSSEGPDGRKVKNYYVPESVGIATGFLIAALHEAGLVTLTHTPSPMGFLNEICGRPRRRSPTFCWSSATRLRIAQCPFKAGSRSLWRKSHRGYDVP